MSVFRPTDNDQAGQVIAWAANERQTIDIVGGGSKSRLGRPAHGEHQLDLSALSGIIDYDPAELVLTARAATPMRAIAEALEARGQMLGFEPPDWSALLDSTAEQTLGGVIACNLSGPRRVRAGAARDHLLGFAAVNGRGERWKAGGKVVKNVTGYDMCKLQAGALGTLSALLELTLRVLPRPPTSCSVVIAGSADADAIRQLAAALNTPHEVGAAAHLPGAAAARSAVASIAALGPATVLRLEGPEPSVAFRAAALAREFGAALRLDAADSVRLWDEIAAVARLLGGGGDAIVWRVCPTPSQAAKVLEQVRRQLTAAEAFYDWGGGLLWLALDPDQAGADGGAGIVREAVAAAGGHATLLRAPEAIRERVAVFEPLPAALAALTRRVKDGFDPNAVLNRGRMHQGV